MLLFLTLTLQADVIQACRTTNEAPLLWAFSVIGATIGFSLTLMATINV